MDTYDQRVYAIGKGPSATSVSIGDDVLTLGNDVLIQGTVTDVSPGVSTFGIKARFPSGVPAVSDQSMSDWMTYVYKQFPRPTNATGVPVALTVLDANGNYRQIGTTTSDSNGAFSLTWTPDIPGKYTVYASFDGSAGYYPSHAETAFDVQSAPATSTPQPLQVQPPTEMYITAATIAIIIAIAIVGAVVVLMIRKRP
jgi:hypothetical protein